MHVGIHIFRILRESLEVIQHRFLEIHFFHQIISSVKPSRSGRGLLPNLFTQWRLQIPHNQEQYFSTKNYRCLPPPPTPSIEKLLHTNDLCIFSDILCIKDAAGPTSRWVTE